MINFEHCSNDVDTIWSRFWNPEIGFANLGLWQLFWLKHCTALPCPTLPCPAVPPNHILLNQKIHWRIVLSIW